MPPIQRRIVKEYPDTPDELFSVEKTYSEANKDLIAYVEQKISWMNQKIIDQEPSFAMLNEQLSHYESVMLALTALHAQTRIDWNIAKEEYDDFYAKKYCEEKINQTNMGKSAQFTSAREIDMIVRKTYIKDLAQLKANILKTEGKYNTLNYLIDGWKNYQFILSQLSKNAIAEAAASGISYKNQPDFGDQE